MSAWTQLNRDSIKKSMSKNKMRIFLSLKQGPFLMENKTQRMEPRAQRKEWIIIF